MKNLLYCAVTVLTLGCLSCNDSGQQDSTKDAKDSNAVKMDSGAATQTTPPIPATVSKEDAQFVVNTVNAGMTEVQLGQIAQQNGMAKDVKEYGAMMVKDHTEAGDRLKALAANKNITVPASVSPEMQTNIADMQKKSGKDFDKAYIGMMIDDHKKVIGQFESESKNGTDADIRAFADSVLPTLKMHLRHAEECHKMMKNM